MVLIWRYVLLGVINHSLKYINNLSISRINVTEYSFALDLVTYQIILVFPFDNKI